MRKTIVKCDRCGRSVYEYDSIESEKKNKPDSVMAKGFIRLTRIYLGESMFIKASLISAVIPLKTMIGYDDTTEGSAVYCIADKMFEKENYICVLESPEKVMRLIEEAEE